MPPKSHTPTSPDEKPRQQYELRVKIFVIQLHRAGCSNSAIIKAVKEKYGLQMETSNVLTWYTPANEKLRNYCKCNNLRENVIYFRNCCYVYVT